jgi:hypothetical protein
MSRAQDVSVAKKHLKSGGISVSSGREFINHINNQGEYGKRRVQEDAIFQGLFSVFCSQTSIDSESKIKVLTTLIRKVAKLSDECMA